VADKGSPTLAISDLDIYRTANLLIRQYCADGVLHISASGKNLTHDSHRRVTARGVDCGLRRQGMKRRAKLAPIPTALYGAALLMSSIAWYILQTAVIRQQGSGSPVQGAIGRDIKGKISPFIYSAGITLAFVSTPVSGLFYFGASLVWRIPDRRVETTVRRNG
jgi:hypothetical protein